jgi:hypothetical protein
MDPKTTIMIISLFVGISGWATFLYNHFSYKPKLIGQVFQVVKGEFSLNDGRKFTSFLTYFYLSNKGRNPVHINDIQLEVKINDKYTKLERVYGLHETNLSFINVEGNVMGIKEIEKHLLYSHKDPVKYGEPYPGFVFFAGSRDLYSERVEFYKATITDIFGNTHIINTASENLGNINRLQEITGMKFQ